MTVRAPERQNSSLGDCDEYLAVYSAYWDWGLGFLRFVMSILLCTVHIGVPLLIETRRKGSDPIRILLVRVLSLQVVSEDHIQKL